MSVVVFIKKYDHTQDTSTVVSRSHAALEAYTTLITITFFLLTIFHDNSILCCGLYYNAYTIHCFLIYLPVLLLFSFLETYVTMIRILRVSGFQRLLLSRTAWSHSSHASSSPFFLFSFFVDDTITSTSAFWSFFLFFLLDVVPADCGRS